ncbi:MAG: hypothetical protein SGILL_009213, partial [Bacillariaceae sp.]
MKGESIQKPSGGGGHTVAGQTVDGTITTAALTASTMGYNKQSKDDFVDPSLDKSTSFGTAAEESTFGEANIETVLRQDGSGFEYVQEVEVRQHRRKQHNNEAAGKSKEIPERYEPISSFGFVEVTSPQPRTGHERRGEPMQSYYPQPKPSNVVQLPLSITEKPDPESNKFNKPQTSHFPPEEHLQQKQENMIRSGSGESAQKIVHNSLSSQRRQHSATSLDAAKIYNFPSLGNATTMNRPHGSSEEIDTAAHRESSYDDRSGSSHKQQTDRSDEVNIKDLSGVAQDDRQQNQPANTSRRPFQRPLVRRINSKDSETEPTSLKVGLSAASSTTSVDRMTVSTGGGAVVRRSRIPSPAPINPDGKRPLPSQSTSPPKRSPFVGKHASQKQSNLPPSGRHTSPSKQQLLRHAQTSTRYASVASSTDSSKLSQALAHDSQIRYATSGDTSSFGANGKIAKDSTVSTNASPFVGTDQVHQSFTLTSEPAVESKSGLASQQPPRAD